MNRFPKTALIAVLAIVTSGCAHGHFSARGALIPNSYYVSPVNNTSDVQFIINQNGAHPVVDDDGNRVVLAPGEMINISKPYFTRSPQEMSLTFQAIPVGEEPVPENSVGVFTEYFEFGPGRRRHISYYVLEIRGFQPATRHFETYKEGHGDPIDRYDSRRDRRDRYDSRRGRRY